MPYKRTFFVPALAIACAAMISLPRALWAQAGIPAQPPASALQSPKMFVVGELKTDAVAGQGTPIGPSALANFRKSLVTGLVKSRKFAVLDREFGDQVGAEKHPTEADRSEAGRTNKIGEEATADYVTTASVKRSSAATVDHVMALSGRHITMYSFALSISVQVIDVASRRIVFADSFDESGGGVVQAGSPDFDGWAYEAMARIADRASTGVLESIYPLKIAAIADDGEVILNEGSGRVAEGDQFEVFAVGEALKDPDTGVEIGKQETLQATINVTRVLPKAAYASVVSSSETKIAPGAICRKPRKTSAPGTGPANTPDSTAPAKDQGVKVGNDL